MTVQHACRCFEQVTCKAVTIRNLNTANELVDTAIAAAMQEKKPVLIQVCSLVCMQCPMPQQLQWLCSDKECPTLCHIYVIGPCKAA